MERLYGRELTAQEMYMVATDSTPLKDAAGQELEPESIMYDDEYGVTYFVLNDGRVLGSNSPTVKKCVDIMLKICHTGADGPLRIRPEYRTNIKNSRDYIFLAYL